jgi:hypothetical protein
MATNREMLKEAIADAKAVKETAIANAKAALEEAFAPQLKSMLSMKLQEMEKEEIDEYGMEHDTTGIKDKDKDGDVDAQDAAMMEIDLEELLAELELEEEKVEELYEAEEEEEEDIEMSDEESEEGEEEGEPIDLEDLTDEDLKHMIEDVIKDMIEAGELEAGHEGMEGEEGAEEKTEDEMSDEEVDLAELLKEIEEMDNDKMYEEKEPVDEYWSGGAAVDPVAGAWAMGVAVSLVAALYAKMYRAYKKDEKLKTMKDADVAKIAKADKEFINSPAIAAADKAIDTAQKDLKEIRGVKSELDEAYEAIKTLKSELNEINLLNAKLLYTNKIFKAKNLNESQKVKVLSSFDKAKNVGEVKMVFETLNEGIKVSKNIIKENLGRASKGTITPNVNKPIVESNEAFTRMQKLAGII